MLQCWNTDADDRPSFKDLHSLFDQFLSVHIQDRYPYMQLSAPYLTPVPSKLAPETGQTDTDGNSFVNLDFDTPNPTLSSVADNGAALSHTPVGRTLSSGTVSQPRSAHNSPHGSLQEVDQLSNRSLTILNDDPLDNSEFTDMRYVQSPVETKATRITRGKSSTLTSMPGTIKDMKRMMNTNPNSIQLGFRTRSFPHLQQAEQEESL